MLKAEDADKYIWAHSRWKNHLKLAITAGKSEFTVEQVCADNNCELGKWIYALPATQQSRSDMGRLKSLHAQFHTEAGRVLKLALQGHKDEAEKDLGMGSEFSRLSASLVDLLGHLKG